MENIFKELVESSEKILITSHISPDPDAISSTLLLADTLKANFEDKDIKAVLEEKPNQDLSFLHNYGSLIFDSLIEQINASAIDLIIIVDANKFERVSRQDWENLCRIVRDKDIKTAVIDHHEDSDKDETDVFINHRAPAAAQEIYTLLFEKLRLNKPEGYAQTAMLGIISDTRRFKYYNSMHRQTFQIVSELIEAGANIEDLENRLSRYNKQQLAIVSELLKNAATPEDGYSYSLIDDSFARKWQDEGKSIDDYKSGCEIFVNQYIRNLDKNLWGFVIYPDLVSGFGNYTVSFRALHGSKDVSVLAQSMGGGGHKSAAAGKFQANSIEDALDKVIKAIGENPA